MSTDAIMPRTRIDTLIEAAWILPIEPAGALLSGHALAIDGGLIVEILPVSDVPQRYIAKDHFKLDGHVLIPGLINLHTHAAMTLLRGIADDRPLMDWLEHHIWPLEAKHLSPAFAHDGTMIACAEMLRGGVTCFSDMYFFPEAAIEAVLASKMRAAIGMVVIDFATNYASHADEYLAKGFTLRDSYARRPLLQFCMAPHGPYTISDSTFKKIAMQTAETNTTIHMHIHETRDEIKHSLDKYGVRPLARLQGLELLSPAFIGVHAVHVNAEEIQRLSEHGCHIAHCPTSNLKLGSGIPPLAAIQARGLNFGLGTDGAASNNRLDLFHEMRHAALLAKGASRNAEALDAHATLRAATLGGAQALGLDGRIGSLLPGKAADLCAVRLDEWLMQPCFDPASHLVYVAGREQVTHTWVAGRLAMYNGTPLEINISELLDLAGLWHTRMTS